MKILAIRGKNIASLEGEFSIDFMQEPLLSAGIFAISGPTGAGKSTLLDTLCLALFARTPRTDQAKESNVRIQDVDADTLMQGDPRFLLRRGTASGYAEADFVALNGHHYRSRWAVARARDKENGRLQNPRTTLINLDTEKEEQGTRSELQDRIIELIGLTFEQFTRSVLLAQNDFSTFLKADQNDKASLLEKLTGTELYSKISCLIYEKNAKSKAAFDAVNMRLQGIELLSDEVVEERKKQLAYVDAVFNHLDKAKAERQSMQESIRQIEQQQEVRRDQQQKAAAELTRATEIAAAARKDYDDALVKQQQCEVTFKYLTDDLQKARKLDVQLENAVEALNEAKRQLTDAQAQRKEAADNYNSVRTRMKEGEDKIDRLVKWIEKYKNKENIAIQNAALLIHIDAARDARNQIQTLQKQMSVLQEEMWLLSVKQTEKKRFWDEKNQALRQSEDDLQKLRHAQQSYDIDEINRALESTRNKREQLLVEQARFAAGGNVRELREKLEEGRPCPVCGSVHHPIIIQIEARKHQPDPVNALTLQIQQLGKQKDTYEEQNKQINNLQQKQLALHKDLSDANAALNDILSQQKLKVSQVDSEEQMIRKQQEYLTDALGAADILFGNSEWQKNWQADPVKFREALADFAIKWSDSNNQLREAQLDQNGLKARSESLASFLLPLEKRVAEVSVFVNKNNSFYESLKNGRHKLLEGRTADEVEKEYANHLDGLKGRLSELQATLNKQTSISQQKQGTLKQIDKDLADAAAELDRRRESLEKWMAAYIESSDGEPLDEAFDRAAKQKTELSFSLRTDSENRLKVAGIEEELNKLRIESEQWGKLNDLAGSADGGKFRRIAQCYTLDILLRYANMQLQSLTRRYRLERVPETLALQVIDHDMCDEIRTVHTLSGGESFLVSLALALGLSSLSSNRMKVESLFIDEGFGSLDAETLRTAMDALENLRTQGRKIGVISHVQEMTERIPVQIRVSRSGNGRSFIEIV
ncbi:MAG: SbcC/MukB-like Walker B domain-containing protein [Parabacteroides sp.]